MNMSSMIDLIGAKPVEPATNRIGLSLSRKREIAERDFELQPVAALQLLEHIGW